MQDPAGQCWAAVIRGGRNKNCFVSLPPASWTSQNTFEDGKLQVFQLQSQSGRIAYVSWSGGLTTGTTGSQDTIELNGLYADKLGFKVGEEVLVKAVPSVASCTRIFVEPLSVDDWEILELHSSFLESHLLNQLRVVWPQQVMPLWVEGAVCIFVTVASMEPNVPCALLEQHTEVVIAPKVRESGSRSSTFKPKAKEDDKLNKGKNQKASANEEHSKVTKMMNGAIVDDVKTHSEEHQRNYELSESKSAQASNIRGIYDFFKFIIKGPQAPLGLEMSSDLHHGTRSEILDMDVNMVLRVQPMKCLDTLELMSENGSHDLSGQSSETTFLLQPTTVYISANTLLQHGYVDIDAMCPSFLAKLTKLPSPKEKREIAKRAAAKTKTDKNLKDKAKGQPGDHDNKVKAEEGQSIVVRVVVVNAQYVVPSRAKTPTENEIVMKGNIYAKKKVTFGEEADNIFEGDEKLGSGGEFHSGGRVHSETVILGGGRVHCGAGVEVSRTKLLETVSDGHILLPEFLRRQGSLGAFTRVHLEGIHSHSSTFTQLSLHPLTPVTKKYTKEMYRTALRVWLRQAATENFPFIITQGALFSLPLGGEHSQEFLLTLQGVEESPDSTETYAQLQESSLDAVRVRVTEQVRDSKKPREVAAVPASSVAEVDCPVPAVGVEDLGGIKSLSQQAIEFLECSIAQRPLPKQLLDGSSSIANGCLLVCGNKGCGKSSFTRGLCAKLSQPPNLAYVEIVECKSLKGKRIEVIQTILRQVFNEAAWRQPAVILLDDLDHVTSSPRSPEMELTGEAMYNAEVAEAVKDILMSEVAERSKVVVIATSASRLSLNQILVPSRGAHIFQEVLQIKPPQQAQRKEILTSVLYSKGVVDPRTVTEVNLVSIASKTEGFQARDLVKVVEKAIHAHLLTHTVSASSELVLTDEDFEAALDGFTPASLRDVPLHTPGELGWGDVGGLQEVRNTLLETLQWPSKYPVLFSHCPLRLRSGLLLYGAPGTGKTLLAGVVAKECGLNFISIKGPELLSKYIGASEQAVRDTFTRAQSAKPCILFFDEFDALAPRRGHDSTGVTDRVVNQLLTQLDGVEGLDGVYVLAATSRPDLIDPALLRPGRLDKSLHCGLPTQAERLDILRVLTKQVNMAEDVDLEVIAQKCHHFTGADFKALLYNAQLEAIHDRVKIPGTSTAATERPDTLKDMVTSALDNGNGLNTEFRSPYDLDPNSQNGLDLMPHEDSNSVASYSSVSDTSTTDRKQTAVIIEKEQPNKIKTKKGRGAKTKMDGKDLERGRTEVEHDEDVTYIPSIEEGPVKLREETKDRLTSEVSRIKSKITQKNLDGHQDSTSKLTTAVMISQSHLFKSAAAMKPSVSAAEREKYRKIYEQFVLSKGGGFSNKEEMAQKKRLTLA